MSVYGVGDINFEGCRSCLDPEADKGKFCVVCNRHECRSRKTICKNCPFCFNSASKKGVGSRVGCGSIFKKYGLIDPGNIGKYQFFYFMYNPVLNFNFPQLPAIDYLGNFNKQELPLNHNIDPKKIKNFKWIIHHENVNDWDDRVWNLILVLNTEHGSIHGMVNRLFSPWKLIQEQSFN